MKKNKKDLKDLTISEESANKMQKKSMGKSSSKQSNALPANKKGNSEEEEKQNVTVITDETYPSSSKAGIVKNGSSRSRSWSEDSQGRPKPGSRIVVNTVVYFEYYFEYLIWWFRNDKVLSCVVLTI